MPALTCSEVRRRASSVWVAEWGVRMTFSRVSRGGGSGGGGSCSSTSNPGAGEVSGAEGGGRGPARQ